jgi:hypothetical protein
MATKEQEEVPLGEVVRKVKNERAIGNRE